MKINYTKQAAEDIAYFKRHDVQVYRRIKKLIEDIIDSPFCGIGKPESLRYHLTGKWSRRITKEHRIVYEVRNDEEITVYQCRYHY